MKFKRSTLELSLTCISDSALLLLVKWEKSWNINAKSYEHIKAPKLWSRHMYTTTFCTTGDLKIYTAIKANDKKAETEIS